MEISLGDRVSIIRKGDRHEGKRGTVVARYLNWHLISLNTGARRLYGDGEICIVPKRRKREGENG